MIEKNYNEEEREDVDMSSVIKAMAIFLLPLCLIACGMFWYRTYWSSFENTIIPPIVLAIWFSLASIFVIALFIWSMHQERHEVSGRDRKKGDNNCGIGRG